MSRAKALRIAARFGFVLDGQNSGCDPGGGYTAIFDHPTHSIGADCRSITETSYPPRAAAFVWNSVIERLEAEGPLLQKCSDAGCDYHGSLAS
jgi:hypothetical protein